MLFGALFAHSLLAALPARAVAALHEFGRLVSRQQEQARHAVGHGAARQLLSEWLQDIAYEKHLLDNADSKEQAAARWHNVQEFCDWMAARCGGQVGNETSAGARAESSLLDVAQTVSLISSLAEREQDPDVVTLSTLHTAKGLE